MVSTPSLKAVFSIMSKSIASENMKRKIPPIVQNLNTDDDGQNHCNIDKVVEAKAQLQLSYNLSQCLSAYHPPL